jgi:glycerophosphoryl diester phosphodiesterase
MPIFPTFSPRSFARQSVALLAATGLFPLVAMSQTLDIQGHRGCRGLLPENTVVAFQKALDLGVTTLELDVVLSQDGQVVVSHEPYFNAAITTKSDGTPLTKSEEKALNLYQMPYAEIRRYDVGRRGNPAFPEQQRVPAVKPLLGEVIEAAEAHASRTGRAAPRYNVEIKSEEKAYGISQPRTVAEFSDRVRDVLIRYLPAERITLQSFDFNVLRHWHAQISAGQYPPVRLAALVTTQNVETTLRTLGFTPAVYSPYYALLSEKAVRAAHEAGLKVIPWTLNEPELMRRHIGWGVDGLITDYPDRVPN